MSQDNPVTNSVPAAMGHSAAHVGGTGWADSTDETPDWFSAIGNGILQTTIVIGAPDYPAHFSLAIMGALIDSGSPVNTNGHIEVYTSENELLWMGASTCFGSYFGVRTPPLSLPDEEGTENLVIQVFTADPTAGLGVLAARAGIFSNRRV